MTDRELQLKAVRLRHDSKPLEFETFINCGEFAIIKRQAAVLIPSNSRGLETGSKLSPRFNPVEFDGIRILKGDSDFKGLEFETFSSLNLVVSRN
jgi:hypothetical protein